MRARDELSRGCGRWGRGQGGGGCDEPKRGTAEGGTREGQEEFRDITESRRLSSPESIPHLWEMGTDNR